MLNSWWIYLLQKTYASDCNQVLSFSNALKRWDILFFSTLSISAYLLKLEMVGGARKKRSVRLALILEYGIPSCEGQRWRATKMGRSLPKCVGPLAVTIMPWRPSA